MKMKHRVLFLLMGLVSCQEEPRAEKVVIQIDEEKLAEVIVKSLVKGSSQFAELAPDAQSGEVTELPEVAELVETKVAQSTRPMVLNLDEEKLQKAIYEGMIQVTHDVVKTIKIDTAVQPPMDNKEDVPKEKIILEMTSENQLYGEVGDIRVLLAADFSQDDLEATKKWLKETTSRSSEKWRLHLRTASPSEYGPIRKLVKLAGEQGISEVVFDSAKKE